MRTASHTGAVMTSAPVRPLPRKLYFTYPLIGIAAAAGMWGLRSTVHASLAVWWLAVFVVAAVTAANAWWMFTAATAPRREGPVRTSGVAAPVGLAMIAGVALRPTVGDRTVIWFCCLGFLCMAVAFGAFLLYRRVRPVGADVA